MVGALSQATAANVTALDSSSGGAVLVSSNRTTEDVDYKTVTLSGMHENGSRLDACSSGLTIDKQHSCFVRLACRRMHTWCVNAYSMYRFCSTEDNEMCCTPTLVQVVLQQPS